MNVSPVAVKTTPLMSFPGSTVALLIKHLINLYLKGPENSPIMLINVHKYRTKKKIKLMAQSRTNIAQNTCLG